MKTKDRLEYETLKKELDELREEINMAKDVKINNALAPRLGFINNRLLIILEEEDDDVADIVKSAPKTEKKIKKILKRR